MLCPLLVDMVESVQRHPTRRSGLFLSFYYCSPFLLLAFTFLLPLLWLYPFCGSCPYWGLKPRPCPRSCLSSSQNCIFSHFSTFLPSKIQPALPQVLPLFYSLGLLAFRAITLASITPWVFHKYRKCQVGEEPHIMVAAPNPEYMNSPFVLWKSRRGISAKSLELT